MTQELRNVFGRVFLTIEIDRENRWVRSEWCGYLTEENIKGGARAYTDILAEQGFSCVLNDTSLLIGSWDRSVEWVVKEWAPFAERVGLRHFALVTNYDSFAEISASSFLSQVRGFEVRVFYHLSEAQQWLRRHSLSEGTNTK